MNSTADLLFSLHARHPGLMAVAIALLKGTAILCLAWGLSRLLLHRSAVSRAWVWRSGFVAMLLLTHFFGLAVAGAYAFSMRILSTPMGFVLTALRQVHGMKAIRRVQARIAEA